MALNALKKLHSMRRVPTNPWAKKAQGLSEEMQRQLRESNERNRALRQKEMYGIEDENKLLAGERRRADLEDRREIGRAMDFLIKEKGLKPIHAYALAVAYGKEIASIEQELIASQGAAKARVVVVAMREELLKIFKNPQMLGQLIKESKSREKGFSQSIMAQVRDQVFEKYKVNVEQ